MLKALYKHRYLRGKVLALISGNSEQKGYDRIAALKKQGLVASETLVKQQRCGSRVINKSSIDLLFNYQRHSSSQDSVGIGRSHRGRTRPKAH